MNYSDYGSGGSSTNSSTSWQDMWPISQYSNMDAPKEPKSASFQDLVSGRCTLEDIMKEFQMNGTDAPYDPLEDKWSNATDRQCGAYLRQRSWPAPERSPAPRLPRAAPYPSHADFANGEFTTSTPIEELMTPPVCTNGLPQSPVSSLSQEQLNVLNSLPNTVLFSLLHELEQTRDANKRARRTPVECRFCKNNGERESYYRSHALKDGGGRVACPVLRAFVCKRCGASGDTAHTIKYCPLSTVDERIKSAAMMRSVRMASGRRRNNSLAPSHDKGGHYMVFGETTPSVVTDNNTYNAYTYNNLPLDPSWAALEQKLML